ncbi:MAG: hypothetical protein ACOCY1_03615, partial [Halovenus sp.]
ASGVVLTGIQSIQGRQQLREIGSLSVPDQLLAFGFGTAPFLLIALALVYVGYWLGRQPVYEPYLGQIVGWGVGSAVLFAAVGALLLFNQQIAMNTLEQGQYIVMNQVTVGAVVGVLVGIYDARGRARQQELEHERDRIETFAGKAADINNYGRELNRAASIEEVSALCIEGLQTLLGLTETGFVVIDGAERRVVNSTIVAVDEERLGDLAAEATEQDRATVELRDGTERADQLLSMLVTAHDDSAVVLLAVTGETTAFADEDIQLVELLVSHAGTALDRIHRLNSSRAEEVPS